MSEGKETGQSDQGVALALGNYWVMVFARPC